MQTYRDDDDPGVHSAIAWLLRSRWGHGERLDQIDRELTGRPREGRRWDVTNREGHTLVVFRDPGEFTMGSPADGALAAATATAVYATPEDEVVDNISLLAETTGVFGEMQDALCDLQAERIAPVVG